MPLKGPLFAVALAALFWTASCQINTNAFFVFEKDSSHDSYYVLLFDDNSKGTKYPSAIGCRLPKRLFHELQPRGIFVFSTRYGQHHFDPYVG